VSAIPTDPQASPLAGLGRRLFEERKRAGLSQADLARRAGVSQAAVSNWESGRRKPDLDDLFGLASSLDIDVAGLLPQTRQPAPALLRAQAERLASDHLRSAVDSLERKAALEGVPAPSISIRSTAPIRAAAELLEAAGIDSPPVPVRELAVACGALVLTERLEDSLSGLVIRLKHGAVIGVNADHHRNRQRFTLAHELGHFVLGHHARYHLDVSDGAEADINYSAERAANEFAAELLMPPSLVEAAYEREQSTGQLAYQFQVSELAMGFRLVNLGLR
jgi:transcriptional regulator with XRE-family HTH domain